MGGRVQRAGVWLGSVARARELAASDTRGGAASGAAGVRWAHAEITLSEGGAVATGSDSEPMGGGGLRSGASKVAMRSGHHFAQFTVVEGCNKFFGAIWPSWDVEGGGNADNVGGHCFYYTEDAYHCPGAIDWEGMQTANEQGDRIGMLLDLDQGSMTVWKNDVRLGVMQAQGLRGPLCWAVVLGSSHARIESAAAPSSPTEEELAASIAWQEAHHADDDFSDSDDE